jgi:hypothetical protein
VEATLAPAENDFLALDDQAWAVVRNSEPVRAILVTRGNFFLQTALNSLNSQKLGIGLELTVMSQEDWQTGRLENSSQPSNPPTLHIFDSYIPATLPSGNLLFIAPPASMPGLFEVLGETTHPTPHPIEKDHPVLQNLDLSTTQILTTTVLSATGWSHLIVAGELQIPSTFKSSNPPTSVPLLLAGEVEGRRVVILPFALQQSDLPLRPAFPILVANLVNYLVPSAAQLVPVELKAGEALAVSVPPTVSRIRWVAPSGNEHIAEARAGKVSLPQFMQPGRYTLSFEPTGSTTPVFDLAVNFFDPVESAIAPQPKLNLTAPTTAGASSVPPPPAQQEWWRLLAIGALILLVVEWLVYQRSVVFKYWTAIRQHIN